MNTFPLHRINNDTFAIGDYPDGAYLLFNSNQTWRAISGATAWKDMIGDLFGKRLLSTAGSVDYDYTNNCIDFSDDGSITSENDVVGCNIEINHEMMLGDSITFKPHIHWFQPVTSNDPDVLDTTPYELTMRYRLIRNSYGVNLTTPEWTTVTLTSNTENNVFDNTNAGGKEYIGQISRFPDITVDCGVSDTFQIQMTRTDSEGGIMKVYFIDFHGEVDSWGSEDELLKS
jgi:hypothetical protein